MGLDVYVGSVSRYVAGDWETVVQKYARESGLELEIVREHPPADGSADPAEILSDVLAWRESLSAQLEEAGGPSLDWDERIDAPYFTDKPAWDAYGDLIVWVAYRERLRTPPADSIENFHDDPVVREAMDDEDTRYGSLFFPEAWLPVDFDDTFQAQWVTGHDMVFGSVQRLARDLAEVNRSSFQGAPGDLARWRFEGKPKDEPLRTGARFALALLASLADEAIRHRLVMKLDD